jgi:hypothetical protein
MLIFLVMTRKRIFLEDFEPGDIESLPHAVTERLSSLPGLRILSTFI